MHKYLLLLALLLVVYPAELWADGEDTYPNPNRLFHVERSKNKNLVCYDVNLTPSGTIDKDNPVKVYWINREERMGERNGLSAIQQRLAYGYKTLAQATIDNIEIALNATKDRKIKVIHHPQHGYICTITVNNQQVRLNKVFVKTKTPNSFSVEYVELVGEIIGSGLLVSEKIYK